MIVRVATLNNFNDTAIEFEQLNSIAKTAKNHSFFINSNIKSINRETAKRINDNNYPIVITFNPDITVNWNYLDRLFLINADKIAFIRVKYIPANADIKKAIHILSQKFKVVLTIMRFKNIDTLLKYTVPKYYSWVACYHRLNILPAKTENVYICDEKHQGCTACGQCAKFTYNSDELTAELNLSSSGHCKFNCPDCYAKKCLNQSLGVIKFDTIKRNMKMKGKLKYNLLHKVA
jgi:hypothetical protein